ncbi:MAG: polysaccharide deacetylase family protein [Armatimonadetes bacterium]|nr:polysaccharide deacetylase family protein [Armatimonadota bacterium]
MSRMICRCGSRKEKIVALTFDDGPDPEYTIDILKILRNYNVQATFFITGKKAQEYPEIVRKLISNRQELGNHSYSHRSLILKTMNYVKSEIEKTDEILKSFGIQGEILFRPPYGRIDAISIMVFWKLQKKIILWDNGPKDFKCSSSDEIVNKVLKKIKSGSIIVLHDGGGDRSNTVKAVEILIPELLKRGYLFKKVSELIS